MLLRMSALLLLGAFFCSSCARCVVSNACTLNQAYINDKVNNFTYLPPENRQVLCLSYAAVQSNYGSNCQIVWQ
ncbi:MAG: hypothetical protein JNM63_05750 [Spirochaetia bacterium]|nr:hypothetical protein [Spirochaetia bacterium]